MLKSNRSHRWIYVLTMFMAAIFLFGIQKIDCQAAITSITVAKGPRAVMTLEDGGYTALFPNLNASASSSNAIYIGYKTGDGTAIRDILLSGKSEESLTVDGCTYKRASEKNLNASSDGDNLYLYYSTDKNAGNPIQDIQVNSYEPNGDEQFKGYALTNDGASPVRKENGAAANFEQGNDDLYSYLMMVKENLYRPYVTNVHITTASSKRKAIIQLSGLGCDYYVDHEFKTTKSKEIMMIGYNRTADVNDAVTSLIGMKNVEGLLIGEDSITWNDVTYNPVDIDQWVTYGTCIYSTKDTRAGNPIYDIYASDVDGLQMTYNDWLKNAYLGNLTGLTAGYLNNEAAYQKGLEDTTELHTISMFVNEMGEKKRGEIVFLREKATVSNSPWEAGDEEMNPVIAGEATTEEGSDIILDPEEETTAEVYEETTEEELSEVNLDDVDEEDLDLSAQPDEEEEEEAIITGSIFGGNSLPIILALVLFAVIAGGITYANRSSRNSRKKK